MPDFENILKNAVQEALEKAAEDELERNSEEYWIGKDDCGCYNNGVGFVTINEEDIYDEEKAYEVAKENIVESIRDNDDEDFLQGLIIDSDKIRNAFADWIEKNF